MLEFTVSVVQTFTVGQSATRVGLVIFGNEGQLVLYLDSTYDANDLYSRIRDTPYLNQATNTADGLQKTREIVFRDGYGDRTDLDNVVIIITDGIPTIRAQDTVTEANLLKEIAEVIVVGITDGVDIPTLEAIATNPNDVILIDDFSGLINSLDSVLSFCNCKNFSLSKLVMTVNA